MGNHPYERIVCLSFRGGGEKRSLVTVTIYIHGAYGRAQRKRQEEGGVKIGNVLRRSYAIILGIYFCWEK